MRNEPRLLPLSAYRLATVAEVAAEQGCTTAAVQRWITDGLLPAVLIAGQRPTYLIDRRALKRFVRPTQGRPRKPAAKRGVK